MKIFIDTSVLVSAAYAKDSVPHQAFKKAVEPPYQGLICEQSLEELRRVYNRKFPDKIHVFERFVAAALSVVELIPVPPSKHPDEYEIRDISDRPILRAAIKTGADIIISGDADFTESGITHPRIVKPAEFLNL